MKKIVLLLWIAALAAGWAATASAGSGLEDLVAAERAFSKHCSEKGFKESFLAVLAEDGVLFRPGPVPGRAFIESRPAPSFVLEWDPVAAEVAASGDLGYTSGPWTFKAAKDQPVAGWGNYFSIWRRQDGGPFQLLVDNGIENPEPTTPATPWKAGGALPAHWAAKAGQKVDPAALTEALLAADRELAAAVAKQGTAEGLLSRMTDDARLLRNTIQPMVGKDAIRTALAADPGGLGWEPVKGGVSKAGDFGYTYGTYKRTDKDGALKQEGSYLRAWRRVPDGAWRVVVDQMIPSPPPPPPPAPPAPPAPPKPPGG
jgi:ketosteroid isomerase-like protein